MVRAVLKLLLNVMLFGEVVVPTATVPNERLVGEKESGARPVPAKFTSCGEFKALSVMVISPEIPPAAEGVNVAVILQFAPTPRVNAKFVALLNTFQFTCDELTKFVPLTVSVNAGPPEVALE